MTDEEWQAFDWLEQTHQTFMSLPDANEEEILNVAKTNGMIPWNAMKAYCDKHNTSYPDWPDFVKF